MTNHDNIKNAFKPVKSTNDITFIKEERITRTKVFQFKKLAIICACLVLVIGLGITAYANYDVISRVFIQGSNMELITTFDENGEECMVTVLNTDNLFDPVIIENNRYIFIANNEHIDITEEIKNNDYFQYEYKDSEGYNHLWIVGLVPDTIDEFGYCEYIKNSYGEWMAGYSAGINIEADGSTNCSWLESAKRINGIPW